MAVAVEFRKFQPTDSREDLLRRVEAAPLEHAEAVLAAYEVLEKLHEADVLNLLSGLIGAKNMVVDRAADVVSSTEMVNLLRISLLAGNLLEKIDPNDLHTVLAEAEKEPPGVFQILQRMTSKDARRALGAMGGLLNVLGAAMRK
jgi:uncharacterized protein YjgD (DUF1641 family)